MTSQLAERLTVFRVEWMRAFNEARPGGRAKAHAALATLYEELGQELPPLVWHECPTEAADSLGGPKERRGADWVIGERSPGANLSEQLKKMLCQPLDGELLSQVPASASSQVQPRFGFAFTSPTELVLNKLRLLMSAHGELDLGHDWSGTWYGSPEFQSGFWGPHQSMLFRYAFLRDVYGAHCSHKASRRLNCWLELARGCSGFWPYEQVVVLADPPRSAHFDEEGRLHHGSLAALEYAKSRYWFWHGTEVPEAWITDPEGVSAYSILASHDLEQRRAGIEMVGWSRLLEQLSPEVVDTDPDPRVGQLLELRLPITYDVVRLLKVRCATGREFVLSVPPTMASARAANAWTYGLDAQEYELEART